MKRVTLYLHPDQLQALDALSTATGKQKSVLVREAVDVLLASRKIAPQRWQQALANARSMWAEYHNAEQRMQEIRDSFNRSLGNI
jgi:predicted transcriptional regulator